MSTPFGALKQVDAGPLSVGYAEAGPADGRAVLLLHGWPYDIHSFADVTPLLASAGYRVIVPFVRGYGTTRFLSDDMLRNGQQAALADDVITLMDALGIDTAILAGFDWGARSADVVAALWPDRCKALVSVSGYLIGSQAAGQAPLPPQAELAWWYQFYFATDRGRAGYEKYRREFSKLIWRLASPQWVFDDATFARSTAAFGHHRAHHHPGGRRQWRAAPGRQRLRQQIHRQVRAPGRRGRHRTQPAARGSAGFRRSHHRRR
jgi:pimeloyl-ACP methyl ester carboxylesterase